jgi:esterase/lipase superfamily enzyme
VVRGILLFIAASVATVGTAASQPSQDLTIPEPCRAGITEDLPTLQKRKQALERQIRRSLFTKTLRRRQEDLLSLIFQIECLRTREQVVGDQAPKQRPHHHSHHHGAQPHRPGAPPPLNIVEVTTYFATNRKPSSNADAVTYGSQVVPLSYGRAVVTIPTIHQPGNVELPSVWRLELKPDPSRHFILKTVESLKADAARAEIAEKLKGSDPKALLVFVHGYNVGFSEAAMRTAQLAYDLRFAGVPLFFSWPSAARPLAYLKDEETTQLSEAAFDQLLEDLSGLPATDIYVIAHSMGTRIVSQVLKSRVDRGKRTSHVSELLLAAPDINADLFRNEIAPKLATMQGTRTTVYASSSDLALRASKVVHGFRRVGETDGGALVFRGVETIDASNASLVMRAFGHSYAMDSKSVIEDIGSIIRRKLSAKQRGLVEAGTLPDIYWRLQ